MKPRIAASTLLLSAVLLIAARQTPMASPRGQSFIPGIPTVIKSSVVLTKAIAAYTPPAGTPPVVAATPASAPTSATPATPASVPATSASGQ